MSQIQHINPDGLSKNPAFSQVIAVSGAVKTVYVGGQDAVDKDGNIVGKGDIAAQSEQVMKNLKTALEAAGAGLEHIIKMTIYIVQGQSLQDAFAASQKVWGNQTKPPTVSVVVVAGLAHPDFLLELDAVAVVPE